MVEPDDLRYSLMIIRLCTLGAGCLVTAQLLLLLSSLNRRPG